MSTAALAESAVIYGLGYGRISGSKEQKDSALSIPSQERFIHDAMASTDAIPVGFDSDILKGTRADRPGYQRTLAAVRRLAAEGKTVVVFVLRMDRFGRDPEERSRAWKALTKEGARLYAVRQGGWVSERFLYDLDAALSQREVDMVGARVRDVNEFVRAHGFPVVGRTAWGYRLRAATAEERAAGAAQKMIELHPNEAPAARRAWEMRATGESLGEIHRWVMSLPAEQVGRRTLARGTFRRMFSAAVYVGRQDYPEKHPAARVPVLDRPRARWEPLVDDDTYRRANAQGAEHRKRPKQATGHHLLTGMIRCYRCGRRMTGRMARTHGRETPRYACVTANGGRDVYAAGGCTTVVNAATLDDGVKRAIRELLDQLNQPARLRAMEGLWEHLRREARDADDTPAKLEHAEQRRAKWANARSGAYADWKASEITQAEYHELRARAVGEIEDAEREIERARATLAKHSQAVEVVLPRLTTVLATLGGVASAFDEGETTEQRAVLCDLIESVQPVPVTRGVYRARIVWTARGRALRKVALAMRWSERTAQEVTVETLAWAKNSTSTRMTAPSDPRTQPAGDDATRPPAGAPAPRQAQTSHAPRARSPRRSSAA